MTRPKCECGGNLKPNRFDVKGNRRYYKFCSPCLISRTYKKRKTPPKNRTDLTKWLRQFKDDSCSMCGFVPEHLCQLDIDHIDGSRHNNDITNYQTLCANCHRLKTYKNKDWEIKKPLK